LPLMLDTTKPPIASSFFAYVPCFPCRCRICAQVSFVPATVSPAGRGVRSWDAAAAVAGRRR
jgi:hypothetical protein